MVREFVISFVVMGACLVLHIVGIVILGDRLVRRRDKIQQHAGPVQVSLILILVFTAIILLHLVQAGIWAVFYTWRGLFRDFESALYFSLMSYSTIGYGDVLLPGNWRLLGTIEGLSGILLCGLSTAFLFAVVNALFQFRIQQLKKAGPVQ